MKCRSYLGAILATILLGAPAWSRDGDDPLLRPIAPKYAARWLAPQKPARIFGNTYLVGFGGLNVALIQTKSGLILIDGALPQAVPEIEANIRSLGFSLKDIKFILSTEPHYDHAGGLAALARDSGATVVASVSAATVLRRGRSGKDDPQAGWLLDFPAVRNVRTIGNGERLSLGGTIVTARATPGHTPGSMSWTWRSCEADRCADMVFASSLNPMAADGYAFSDPAHRSLLAGFRRTFATMRNLRCDILLTPHPDQSGGDVKFRQLQQQPKTNPFLDTRACRDYADRFEQLLDERIASEKVGHR